MCYNQAVGETWMKRLFLPLSLFVIGILLLGSALPASANPPAQIAYYTPTARPDGRIVYIWKEGDSCISVALMNSVSEQQIRDLNGITSGDCAFGAGQEVVLATLAPTATPTFGPSPTPTTPPPTATPFNGTGKICVYLYEDTNGNAMPDDNEYALGGGAVSISETSGKFTQTGKTDDSGDPICYDLAPEGEYNVSIAVPDGYNPTTVTSQFVDLIAGSTMVVDFGAQPSETSTVNEGQGGFSPLLGVFGFLLVAAGLGLGWYMRRLKH